ncbi:tetratricopeptide repeat protein [Paracoccus aurantiacus]|uniref:Tetratricopeptide repeat protein n=1 Tax=Paracoccus aurantiacus TaxID=2599412 RepID=A0A5C6S4N2_9RHOB|nr:tetratricopeptide repeat protein [Paracoccus aurantiacus]TXB68543.1 tetratricopeptide repeat protein [Paracoccus aurantiacus]
MVRPSFFFHHAVTALALSLLAVPALAGKADPLLFDRLAQMQGDAWMEAETQILSAWEDTGSQALNMIQLRGETALDEGNFSAAIGHLTALTDHAPDHAMGFQLRGMAYWLNGDYGPAAADLARALELEPKQYLALTQLGSMLEELGDHERAAEAIRRSLEINPHQQDAIDAAIRLEAEDNGTNI